jgi:hypothetical protein
LHLAGWKNWDIAEELGIGTYTLYEWLRNLEPVKLGRLRPDERQALKERIAQMRQERPEASSAEIAKVLGIEPRRVVNAERARGKPMPRQPGAHKIGKYEVPIRQMLDQGMTCKQMAAELKRRFPNAKKTPSHSGIWYFIRNRGWKVQRRGGGRNLDPYAGAMREMAEAGKSKEEIARELDGPSRSGTLSYIKRLGLRTVPGNRGKRVVRAQNTAENPRA